MNAKTLNGLIIVALVALAIAIALNVSKQPQSSEDGAPAQLFVPQLREHLNDITGITITGAGNKTVATLRRGENGWGVVERSNYPADLAKLREFLLKLSEASVIETKTASKEKYADLGVTDIEAPDAKGTLVALEGLSTPVQVIVGNYNGGGGGGTFMRRAGEAQSYLVRGNLGADRTVANWLKRELTDIPATRVKEVVLNGPDGKSLKVMKETANDANYKLADIPKDREPSSEFVANGLAAALAGLRFDDVLPAKDAEPADKAYKAHYGLFDGVSVEALAWEKDGKNYARFSAALNADQANAQITTAQQKAKADYETRQAAANTQAFEAKPTTGADTEPASSATAQKDSNAEAAAKAAQDVAKPLAVSDPAKDREDQLAALNKEVAGLNQVFQGWTFVLPNFKFANMNKTMDEMLKPLDAKKSDGKDAKPGAGNAAKKPEVEAPQRKG